MTVNPYRASLRQAQRVDRELERLFGKYLGSAEHPRGAVLTAYRVAIAAIQAIYRRGAVTLESEVRDVLNTLRMTLQGIAREAVAEAANLGQSSAVVQVAAYQKAGVVVPVARQLADVEALTASWMASVTGQVETVATMAAAGTEAGMVQAALVPSHIAREGSKWIASAASLGLSAWTQGRELPGMEAGPLIAGGEVVQRQAIAAIDGRTTDCCLAVHGQIVGWDEPFNLTADPRPWGNELMRGPFHWNCRTLWVTYRQEWDDGVTGELRDQAQFEKGRRVDVREKIADVQQRLAVEGAKPDARRLKEDSKEVGRLRRELKRLRKELAGAPRRIYPRKAVS